MDQNQRFSEVVQRAWEKPQFGSAHIILRKKAHANGQKAKILEQASLQHHQDSAAYCP